MELDETLQQIKTVLEDLREKIEILTSITKSIETSVELMDYSSDEYDRYSDEIEGPEC